MPTTSHSPLFSTATPVLSQSALQIAKAVLCAIEGIAEVRVLPVAERPGTQRAKFFVVLKTHDVRRDSQIVERLCQLPDIDFDLVPESALAMIPDAAHPIRLH